MEARIKSATRMIGGMSKAVLRRELSKGTKLNVVNATMIPSLLCGFEVWNLMKR